MNPAVIVDMDGTLVDVRSVRHHVTGPNRDFDAFHRQSVDCPPHDDVVTEVRRHHQRGTAIIVVTARTRRYRRLSSMWLAMHHVPSTELHMRPDGDFRRDVAVKRDILTSLQHRYRVIHAIDDNPHVIALWEEKNIPVTVVPGWEEQN